MKAHPIVRATFVAAVAILLAFTAGCRFAGLTKDEQQYFDAAKRISQECSSDLVKINEIMYDADIPEEERANHVAPICAKLKSLYSEGSALDAPSIFTKSDKKFQAAMKDVFSLSASENCNIEFVLRECLSDSDMGTINVLYEWNCKTIRLLAQSDDLRDEDKRNTR